MLYIKQFEFIGQQVNYYNKVRKNPNIAICWMANDMKLGLIVCYKYKKKGD